MANSSSESTRVCSVEVPLSNASQLRSPSKTPRGKMRVKPEPKSEDDEQDDNKPYAPTSPAKKQKSSTNSSSGNNARGALPAPFIPDPSITAPNDPRLMCVMAERVLTEIGGKLASEVANEFGVDGGKLGMKWRNTFRKKCILAIRKEFLGGHEA